MNKSFLLLIIAFFSLAMIWPDAEEVKEESASFHLCSSPEWGFFGHRRINRMAVFTLPPEMMIFYKKHIEYITNHAVDPDKRRYATRHEAVRHYIDIDHWGECPFENVPRIWTDALLKYASLHVVNNSGDTINVIDNTSIHFDSLMLKLDRAFVRKFKLKNNDLSYDIYRSFFSENILNQYYEDHWSINPDSLNKLLQSNVDIKEAFMVDHFSEFGILPYHLLDMQRKLTRAFEKKDIKAILRHSADFGHYIGDAHVPLHTTTNYNGQLTDQVGIHAFWESRIPELFADKEFDFFVGKASYIKKPRDYYWDIVLTSHSYVDSVLLIEKSLSKTFPEDLQYCYDDRMEATVRTQCKAYAAAYKSRMDGMVEARMRGSVSAVGNAWYSAWVNAGQPDLNDLVSKNTTIEKDEALENAVRSGDIKGRAHNN